MAIDVKYITKIYDNKYVLDHLSFNIKNGEILGLAGKNGSGKTTAIKIISGIIRPNTGDVLIDDISIIKSRKKAIKKIAWIPENNILDNMDSPKILFSELGTIYGYNNEEIKSRSEYVMDKLNILNYINKRFSTFSNGNKKRFLIALALFQDTNNYVFDESFSNLDPYGILLLKNIIMDLKSKNKSILFSSHILSELQEISDKFAIIDHGYIVSLIDKNNINGYVIKIKYNNEKTFNFIKSIYKNIDIINNFIILKVKKQDKNDLIKKLNENNIEIEYIGSEKLEDYFTKIH